MVVKERDVVLLRRVRLGLGLFMVGLLLSGLTALPLVTELKWVNGVFGEGTAVGRVWPAMGEWVTRVYEGIVQVDINYPFMLYGTDWLAFAHIMLTVLFVGAWRGPVKNVWVIQFGMIACVSVIPLALIFGPIREIPFFHQVIDCSFGVFGIVPLALVYRWVREMGQERHKA